VNGEQLSPVKSEVVDLLKMEAELEQRQAIVERVHCILNRKLDPERDISMVFGRPCRNKNAAKIAYRIFGGTFEFLKDDHGCPILLRRDYSDSEGAYYVYECFGRYTPPFGMGDSVEASGMFSSRDQFLGMEDSETDAGEKKFKNVSQVDEASIRQAAQTECFKKCVFLGLGLPELTEDDLKALGVDTSKTPGHRGEVAGKKGGSVDSDADTITRGEIELMCRELFKSGAKSPATGKPFTAAEAVLQEATHNDNFKGWNKFPAITVRALKITHEQVTAFHKKLTDDLPY
jgi:hypothetical protein